MPNLTETAALTKLISVPQLAEFFDCSETMARRVMRRIEIPKRGGGYSKQRLWAALGFSGSCPAESDSTWQPLLDVPAVAKIANSSARTIGRMFDGHHADKTFTNFLWLGPRKRLIFRFELEAWLTGQAPRFERPVERIHPGLRPGVFVVVGSRNKPDRAGKVAPPTSGLFLSPGMSC
ncbi:hypothetical protein [Ruegeria intermedia]|uniref:hypothetical protein n=1 Tax=Ruegeria intermedia TaxID=996115 RepID=UPI00122CCD14|nr:hypothetical protein [Ruegeria intermedia]